MERGATSASKPSGPYYNGLTPASKCSISTITHFAPPTTQRSEVGQPSTQPHQDASSHKISPKRYTEARQYNTNRSDVCSGCESLMNSWNMDDHFTTRPTTVVVIVFRFFLSCQYPKQYSQELRIICTPFWYLSWPNNEQSHLMYSFIKPPWRLEDQL